MGKQRRLKQERTLKYKTINKEDSLKLEKIKEADREYFRKHPTATEYYRPLMEGETFPDFPGDSSKIVKVLVQHIAEGVRIRTPITSS